MARLLGDLAELTVGHVGPMASEYVQEGIPFLRSLNIRPFRIDLADVKYITPEFHSRLRKSALAPGDVVVVRTGAPGTAAVIPDSLPSSNCSDLVVIRPGKDLDSRYLAALINGISRGFVFSRTVGAVQQHFNVGSAREIPVPDTSLEEQRRIAGVLGAFDDLIETNRKLGRALWDAFDVSWKIASEGCSDEIAVRDIATLNKGISYKGEFLSDSGELMVNLANFGLDGKFKKEGTKHYQGPVRTNRTLIRGDLVVANTDLTQRREILGRPVLVPFDNATSTHHTFQVRVSGGEHVRGWLFGALRDGARRRRLIASSTGTTVAALPPDALLALTIPSAHPPVGTRWWDSAKRLIDAADALEREAETLGEVRDELLPLLMSGRTSVDEAWEAVS